MVHVALRFGERAEVAYVLPLPVDGLLVVASARRPSRRSGRGPWWPGRRSHARRIPRFGVIHKVGGTCGYQC
ncbi:MAG: hypothetical protein JXA67_20830 [Micromonosporaceae bacterium]|nr:hypothetical protein [Micromonosporaceae bacterium]